EVGFVVLSLQSHQQIGQDAEAEIVIHLSNVDTLPQPVAESLDIGQIRLNLPGRHLFINSKAAAPRHSHGHGFEAVVVTRNASGSWCEAGVCALQQWKTSLDGRLNGIRGERL